MQTRRAGQATHYDILGLDPTAAADDIRSAFKERALLYHPDKNPNGEAAFKAISTAYQVLKDPRSRGRYDADLRQAAPPPPPPRAHHTTSSATAAASSSRETFERDKAREDAIFRDAFAGYGAAPKQRSTPTPTHYTKHAARTHSPAAARPVRSPSPPPPPPTRDPEAEAAQRRSDADVDRRVNEEAAARAAETSRVAAAARAEAEAIRLRVAADVAARRKASEEAALARQTRVAAELGQRQAEAIAGAVSARARIGVSVTPTQVQQDTSAFADSVGRWDTRAAVQLLEECRTTPSRTIAAFATYPIEHPKLGSLATAAHGVAASLFKRPCHHADELALLEWVGSLTPAELTFRDVVGRTVLHVAAANGTLRVIRAIVDALRGDRSALVIGDESGASALDYAASNGSVNAVEVLLEAGCPVEGPPDKKRRTPLHAAVRFGNAAAAAVLLKAGANPNAADVMRWTPLHFAADEADAESVEWLLKFGADRGLLTPDGQTPAQLAVAAARSKGQQCAALLRC